MSDRVSLAATAGAGVLLLADGESIFELGADAIVNPVNCVGVMGRGLAFAFKERFPDNYATYARACRAQLLQPGGLHVHGPRAGVPRYIVNIATKGHWRDSSRIEWVREGCRQLRLWAEEVKVASLAVPAIGAGLGGLPWEPVRALVEDAFVGASFRVFLLPPGTPVDPSPRRPGARHG